MNFTPVTEHSTVVKLIENKHEVWINSFYCVIYLHLTSGKEKKETSEKWQTQETNWTEQKGQLYQVNMVSDM